MIELPDLPEQASGGNQYWYGRSQKDMLRWFVEWLEKYNRSVWGGFSGDIPPVAFQELKDKLAELEG